MSASAPWWKPSAAPLSPGSTGGSRRTSMSAASDDAQASEIKAWLRGRPEVDAVLPGGRAEVQIDGMPDRNSRAIADHATYRDHWPLLRTRTASAWDGLPPGDAGLVSEQLSRRLKLGDRRSASNCRRRAATGRSRSSASMPTTAIRRARSPSMSRPLDPPLSRRRRRRELACASGPRQVPALIIGAAGQIRPRRPQPDGSGDAEGRSRRGSSTSTFAVTAALNTFTLGVAGIALLDQPVDA